MKKIKQIINTKKDKHIMIFLYIITLLLFLFFGLQCNNPYLVDETGTIAPGAYLSGYDWSTTNYSMGNYPYKYFQSLFYIPILKLINNPFLIYKAIVIIQGILYSIIPVLVYYLLRKCLKVKSKIKSSIISLLTALLPTPFLLSTYVTADLLLTIIPWIIIILLCISFDNQDKKKQNIYTILITTLTMVAYMAHSRGIVLIIGLIIFLMLIKWKYKKNLVNTKIFIISLITLLGIDHIISTNLNEILYINGIRTEDIENIKNETLKNILTQDGFIALIKLIIGWIYAFICSGFFIPVIGLLAPFFNKTKELTKEKIIMIYSIIIFFLALMVGITWLYYSTTEFLIENIKNRADRVIYIRYLSSVLGPIFFIGIYQLLFKPKQNQKIIPISVIITFLILFLFFYLVLPQLSGIQNRILTTNIISILPFLKVTENKELLEITDLAQACFITLIIVLVLTIIIYILYKKQKTKPILILLSIISIINITTSFYNMRYIEEKHYHNQIKDAVSYINNFKKEVYQNYPNIIIYSNIENIRKYQVALKNYHFHKNFDNLNNENVFIIFNQRKYKEFKQGNINLNGEQQTELFNDTYYKFIDLKDENDILIIKGKKLKNYIEKLGYKVEEIKITQNNTSSKY